MAITRAQQYKQMLQKGGRIGFFKGAQADASAGKGAMSPGTSTSGGGRDVGGSDFGQFERRTRQNVASQRKGFLGKDQGMNIGPQSPLARFGDVARGGLMLALSAVNPAFGLLSRIGKDFRSSRTLEEFRDKRRGFGRTMPTIFNNPNLDQFIDEEEDTTSPIMTAPVTTNNLFENAMAKLNTLETREYNTLKQAEELGLNSPEQKERLQDLEKKKNEASINNIMLAAEGGSMNDQIRQAYGLGSIVKKATRAVKKVAKSPVGKAAIAYTLTGGLGNLAQGQGFFTNFASPSAFLGGAGSIFSKQGLKNIALGTKGVPQLGIADTAGILGSGGALSALKAITAVSLLPLLGLGTGQESEEEAQQILQTQGIDIDAIRSDPNAFLARRFKAEGGRIGLKDGEGIMKMASYGYDDAMGESFAEFQRLKKLGDIPIDMEFDEYLDQLDIDIPYSKKDKDSPSIKLAEGGRIGYAGGTSIRDYAMSMNSGRGPITLNDFIDIYKFAGYDSGTASSLGKKHYKTGVGQDSNTKSFAKGGSIKEPVAKKTMPLLDMGGQEMDLRAEGGFVPIGRMEKADDVPARLSKNEFVFTADAVRNAGDGDVDKGAEVMYNMMKNLEAGGNVSEESQGLEGARRMFQTSKRLEEVL